MADGEIAGTARDIGDKLETAMGPFTADAKTKVQDKVDHVAGKAQTAFRAAKDATSVTASDAKSAIGGMAGQISSQASELSGQAYEHGAQAAKYVGKQIQNGPLLAMLAGALGMFIGYLIGRPPYERSIEAGRFRAAYRDR